MTEQPPDLTEVYTPEQGRAVRHHAYRLVAALVTARDDAVTRRQLIKLAIDDMPTSTQHEALMLLSMLATSVSMLAEYMQATAAAYDEATHEGAFQERHRATIRTELLED